MQRHRRFADGIVADAARSVHALHTQPQLGVHQHRLLHVTGVEPLAEVAEEHDGELQALGLVDGHDAHAAGALAGGEIRRVAVFQQRPQVGGEVEQALFPRSGHLPGVGVEGRQVVLPGLTARHGAEHRLAAAGVVDAPQQHVHRLVPGGGAKALQRAEEVLRVGAVVQQQGVVVVAVLLQGADGRQTIRREAEQG